MSAGDGPLFPTKTALEARVEALRADLLAEGGPRISTMRTYRFALLLYPPRQELDLRRTVRHLVDELRVAGWSILEVCLKQLLIDRIRRLDEPVRTSLIDRERRLHAKDPERALAHLRDRLAPEIEGPDGIAADVSRLIDRFVAERAPDPERSLVLIGRAGALYPFFRSSALLKFLDGRTKDLPVVLLYPGERSDTASSGLSFMGRLAPDRDYRPRIYA